MSLKKILYGFFLVAVFCVMFFLSPILFPSVAGISLAGIMLNGPYGNYTGKVGGTIAAMWKGINYLKAYVKPANPNSAGQQAQRTKFKTVVALAQTLIPTLITTFWNPFAVGMSGFNAFVKNVFADMTSAGLIQPGAQVAKGTLEGIGTLTVLYTTGTGASSFEYTIPTTGNGLGTDTISILVLSKTDNSIIYYNADAGDRSAGPLEPTLPTGLTATDLICFAWASRGTGEDFIVSNSSGDTAAAI